MNRKQQKAYYAKNFKSFNEHKVFADKAKADIEKDGKFHCCDMCFTKAKYTFDDDDGVDSYRCGNHSKSLNDRIRRVRIN